MKKWTRPEIYSVNISNTAYDWDIQCSLDGGYLGDGQISGWFGPAPGTQTDTSTDAGTGSSDTVVPPVVVEVDELS